LIDTFKIMNIIYDVHSELFFNLDEGGRRGHEKSCSKKIEIRCKEIRL